jgi:hypothetical protein
LDFTSASVYFFGVGWSVSVWLRPDQEYLGDYTTGNVLDKKMVDKSVSKKINLNFTKHVLSNALFMLLIFCYILMFHALCATTMQL